jgi:predicted acetyltransferase
MTFKFRRLDKTNVSDCIRGWKAAFPNWKYDDALKMAQEQVDSMPFFGAYEDGIYKGLIVGADTSFNYRGVKLSGIELDHLHVDPLYRKQGVSKFLISEFQKYARSSGYHMINVGPFSTEFYRSMGYGFGAKAMSFTAAPEKFQYYKGSSGILEYFDGEKYKNQLENFIREQRISYHGGFNFKENSLENKFEKMCDKNRIVVMAVVDGKVCGVINYEAARKIVIEDIFFERPDAIKALSSYMHSLKGNIESITIEYAYPAILAVCNEPMQIKLKEESMIKVINIKKFLEEIKDVDFDVEDMEMELKLYDALSGDYETISLSCENGTLKMVEKKNCKIKLEMMLSDFTTMLFSQQLFCTYIEVGLAKINEDKYIWAVNKLFSYDSIPFNI